MTIRRALSLIFLACGFLTAQEVKIVPLPKPQTDGGQPLMRVLQERKTSREFDKRNLPPQVLSNLLWAAWGINRPDGRRTAPSSTNRQEIEIYVATADGTYRYDAQAHGLELVAPGDLRAATGTQAFVREAPVNLVYVADYDKMGSGSEQSKAFTSGADTGFIGQNVYLFCASEGLATVIRGSVDRTGLAKAMNLRPAQRVTLSQSVGYPKK